MTCCVIIRLAVYTLTQTLVQSLFMVITVSVPITTIDWSHQYLIDICIALIAITLFNLDGYNVIYISHGPLRISSQIWYGHDILQFTLKAICIQHNIVQIALTWIYMFGLTRSIGKTLIFLAPIHYKPNRLTNQQHQPMSCIMLGLPFDARYSTCLKYGYFSILSNSESVWASIFIIVSSGALIFIHVAISLLLQPRRPIC